jgi:hypothetical protein
MDNCKNATWDEIRTRPAVFGAFTFNLIVPFTVDNKDVIGDVSLSTCPLHFNKSKIRLVSSAVSVNGDGTWSIRRINSLALLSQKKVNSIFVDTASDQTDNKLRKSPFKF